MIRASFCNLGIELRDSYNSLTDYPLVYQIKIQLHLPFPLRSMVSLSAQSDTENGDRSIAHLFTDYIPKHKISACLNAYVGTYNSTIQILTYISRGDAGGRRKVTQIRSRLS